MALPEDIAKIKDLPTAFVIFGATGDLSRKKIFPSFYELSKSKLLPKKFRIIAAARSQFTSSDFAESLRENIQKIDGNAWDIFAKQIKYISCDVDQDLNLEKIEEALAQFEEESPPCVMRIFYMAISPMIYERAFENLGKHKLNLGCQIHNRPSRIVIEKPFGFDYQSAQRLQSSLTQHFSEEQIYRIDHYLGKETVQNILALRFGNEIFEPVWNNRYVDHVQITFTERIGIGKRGAFYEKIGALRDVVQNHLFQLLALITMEEPDRLDHQHFRKSRLEIIKSIKRPTADEIASWSVRGQYEGYRQEENVDKNSQTETFVALRLFLENKRWQGVPIYFRTGKKLLGDVTSIILQFKEKGHKIFENFWEQPMPNQIMIQIKPTEGIGIRLVAKKPGLITTLEPVDMEFCYKTSFDVPNPDAYERLLMEVMLGDRTLFVGQVGESWKIIDRFEEVWASGKPKLSIYKPGSWGPKEADSLIKKDGRQWLAPYLTICKI